MHQQPPTAQVVPYDHASAAAAAAKEAPRVRLLVFPDRYAKGYSGPQDTDAPTADFTVGDEPADVWLDQYTTDAHCVAYTLPKDSGDKCPRLNKPGGTYLESEGHTPLVEWMILDVDVPLTQAELDRLSEIPEIQNAGLYLTVSGYRLVWALPEPIPYFLAEDHKALFVEYVSTFGIAPDPKCMEWNRMYRMPLVPRYANLDEPNFEQIGTLAWKAPRALQRGQVASRASEEWASSPRPAIPIVPPKKSAARIFKNSPYFTSVTEGLPLAGHGARNSTTFAAIGYAAKKQVQIDAVEIYTLLAASVQAQVDDGSKWDLAWLWEKINWVCAREAGAREEQDALRYFAEIALAEGQAAMANVLGVEAEDISRHLVITVDKGVYVMNEGDGSYGDAVSSNLLLRELRRRCPSICPSTTDENGRSLDDRELLARYSTSAVGGVVFKYGLSANFYDARSGVMLERAASPRRDLLPKYHGQIDEWLRIFGGANADKLLDWLACILDVESPIAALYIRGENSVGKGLLGEGLSQIWGAACAFEQASKEFNQRMLDSPLIWADEKAEVDFGRSASALIRRLVGSTDHTIRRLHRPPGTLVGCPRLLFTANNKSAIKFEEALSAEDVQALIRRFGYVDVPSEARDFLESIGGRAATNSWVEGRKIAEHVMWLRDNRSVLPGPRYLVEGWGREFAEDLVVSRSLTGQVIAALLRLLGNHGAAHLPIGISAEGGYLYVYPDALIEKWKDLMPSSKNVPNTRDLVECLSSLSVSGATVRRYSTVTKRQYRCWQVNGETLIRAAANYGQDPEDIHRVLYANGVPPVEYADD